MKGSGFDIERVKAVLREATSGPQARFSQRGLGVAAGEGRDCVGDILNGRNKNPTTKVLANLARELGGDLSIFGLAEERVEPPTVDELEAALRDTLPDMKTGSLDRRARFLAEAVGHILKLPKARPSTGLGRDASSPEGDAPPPGATRLI